MKGNKKGFTLIELLVVISIIGLLSTVVLAGMQTARQKAKNSFITTSMKSYITALKGYYADHGGYPVGSDGSFCLGKANYDCFGSWFAVSYFSPDSTSTMYSNDQLASYVSSLDDPSPYPNLNGHATDNRGAGLLCEVQNGNLCLTGCLFWTVNQSADKKVNCGDIGGATNSSINTPCYQNLGWTDSLSYLVGNYCYLEI